MLRRMLVIAAATAALVVGAAPAGAQQYPPPNNSVTVDDVTPHPCQAVTITAGTFSPGSTVEFTLASTLTSLGSATADASGVASLTAAIPEGTQSGEHTITASGTSESGPLSLPVTVEVGGSCAGEATATPAAEGPTGALPKTGSNSTMPLARAAALLMAVGGVLLLATRRRRVAARAH